MTVRAFCQEAGVHEHAFFHCRKRLREERPAADVRFALVEATAGPRNASEGGIELTLTTGETLRIQPGADPATVRMVRAAPRP